MKKLFRLSALLIAVSTFMGCPPDQNVVGDVKFAETGERTATLTFSDPNVLQQTIDIQVAGEWKATVPQSWVTVAPKSGKTTSLTTKTISVGVEPYDGTSPRSTIITFVAGTRKATLTITQEGKDGSPLYSEDFGPAVSANTEIAAHTGFTRGGTLDQSAVTYASTQASPIRKSMPPTTGLPEYSGPSLIFMNTGKTFTIGNINVTGNEALTLRFSAAILSGTYEAGYNVELPSTSLMKLEIGYDGTNWANITDFTAVAGSGSGTGNYAWVTAPFKVATGTTAIYVRISSTTSENNRFDDFTISAGGNGTLIVPGGGGDNDPVLKTIAEVRTAGSVQANWYLEGTIISDYTGQNLQAYQIALQDGTGIKSGIMINGASGVTFTYPVGTRVRVNLTNGTLGAYNGLAQIAGVLATDVTTISTGTAITTPQTITVAQLATGNYESMFIQIANVEMSVKATQNMNSGSTGNNGNIVVQTDASNTFTMRTASRAVFAADQAPMGKGTLIGIAGIYTTNPTSPAANDFQVSPRTFTDVSGMDSTPGNYFTVSVSGAKPVGYAAGSFDVNVNSNVAWTAVSSDPTNFAVNNSGATGNATVKVTYTENASTTNTRSATITFSTTADVATKTYTINITQDYTPPVGSAVDFLAGWIMTGIPDWGVSSMAATSNDSNGNITVGDLTKVNFATSGSPGASNWGGYDFTGNTAWDTATKYAYFTVTSTKTFSLANVILRLRFTKTGPGTTALAYQIGSGALTLIESHDFATSQPSGTSNYNPYTYVCPSALQNLAGGTVVTIRIIPIQSSWSSSGNWYISNNGFTGEPLQINGSFVE